MKMDNWVIGCLGVLVIGIVLSFVGLIIAVVGISIDEYLESKLTNLQRPNMIDTKHVWFTSQDSSLVIGGNDWNQVVEASNNVFQKES